MCRQRRALCLRWAAGAQAWRPHALGIQNAPLDSELAAAAAAGSSEGHPALPSGLGWRPERLLGWPQPRVA